MGGPLPEMEKGRLARSSAPQEFYSFFCRWSSDASTAAASVAAGCVAGGLLVLVAALTSATIIALIQLGLTSLRPLILFGLATCSAVATYATWSRVVSGAIVNATLGVGLAIWECTRGDLAVAVVLFVPVVCGSITAARGAYNSSDLPKYHRRRNTKFRTAHYCRACRASKRLRTTRRAIADGG